MENPSLLQKVHHMTTSVLLEAQGHVSALIGPRLPGERVKRAIPQIARRLGMSERRVKAFLYGEAKSVRADEMDLLRQAADTAARKKASHGTLEYAARLEADAEALEAIDPDFHRESIDRLRNTARLIRRAVAGEG